MSKVDLILDAAARRGQAPKKAQEERAPVRPVDILRLIALSLCIFVAGLVLLSQPQVRTWLDGAYQTSSGQVKATLN